MPNQFRLGLEPMLVIDRADIAVPDDLRRRLLAAIESGEQGVTDMVRSRVGHSADVEQAVDEFVRMVSTGDVLLAFDWSARSPYRAPFIPPEPRHAEQLLSEIAAPLESVLTTDEDDEDETFVAIKLVGPLGEPVAGARFEAVVNGASAAAETNDDGMARLEPLPEGNADIVLVEFEPRPPDELAPLSDQPAPGVFYRPQRGDSFLSVIGKAYNLPAGQGRLAASKVANGHAWNRQFHVESRSDFAKKHYPDGLVSLRPLWASVETETEGGTLGKGFPLIYLPTTPEGDPEPNARKIAPDESVRVGTGRIHDFQLDLLSGDVTQVKTPVFMKTTQGVQVLDGPGGAPTGELGEGVLLCVVAEETQEGQCFVNVIETEPSASPERYDEIAIPRERDVWIAVSDPSADTLALHYADAEANSIEEPEELEEGLPLFGLQEDLSHV